MKIGIYSPYLDTLGGGERYMFSLAACFANDNDVQIFWNDPSILSAASEQFYIDLSRVSVVRNFWRENLAIKLSKTKQYDVIFYLSDGSIPTSLAGRTYLHFQFPVTWVNGRSFLTQLKIKKIAAFICNSQFTKSYIDKTFGVNSLVIEPGIDTHTFTNAKKERIILSVGRFTGGMNVKRQDFLIESYKKLHDADSKNWKLVLAGAMMDKDKEIIGKLQSQIGKYPVTLIPNISFSQLQSLYSKASIYWHAAGYGENLSDKPQLAEHFGISTVEAMCSGAVPIVFAGGGQREIVSDGKNGFLWNTGKELISKSQHLLENTELLKKISTQSIEDSQHYDIRKFCEKFHRLVTDRLT